MTQNELLAGSWLRDSLHEGSSVILTNYLKTYQPETLEQVFSFLERDFAERQNAAATKHLETDSHIDKADYIHWGQQIEMVSKARENYEKLEESSPSEEYEVAFRYRYPARRIEEIVKDKDGELQLRDQLLRLTKLCDRFDELIKELKSIFLSNPHPDYTEDSFEDGYGQYGDDLRLNRKIETWYEWKRFSISEKNQQVEYQLAKLTQRVSQIKESIAYEKRTVERYKP